MRYIQHVSRGYAAQPADILKSALGEAEQLGLRPTDVAKALVMTPTQFADLVANPSALTDADIATMGRLIGLTAEQLILTAAIADDDGSGHESCPFCGAAPVKRICSLDRTVHNSHSYLATFGCQDCTAQVSARGDCPAEAWANAIDLWDQRT